MKRGWNLELSFDKVWKDLLELASSKESISTLSQHVSNDIKPFSSKSIIVVSERTLIRRFLRKERFRLFWSVLKQKGSLVRENIPASKRMYVGRIIFSILAHLPYVEYELKPQRLYLMQNSSHPLGTLKKRS